MSNIIFTDDCIQTVDLWCQKQSLYQLSHNHFQHVLNWYSRVFRLALNVTGKILNAPVHF